MVQTPEECLESARLVSSFLRRRDRALRDESDRRAVGAGSDRRGSLLGRAACCDALALFASKRFVRAARRFVRRASLYYLWTLQLGARASDVGRTGWANIAFIFYELLGQAGLGPGRLALRAHGTGEVAAFLPMMIVGAIGAALFAPEWFHRIAKERTATASRSVLRARGRGAFRLRASRRRFRPHATGRTPSHSAAAVPPRTWMANRTWQVLSARALEKDARA